MAFAVQVHDSTEGEIVVEQSIDDDWDRVQRVLKELAYQSFMTGWHVRPGPDGRGFRASRESGRGERWYRIVGFDRRTSRTFPLLPGADELRSSTVEIDVGLWIGGNEAAIPEGVRLVVTLEDLTEAPVGIPEVRYPFKDSRWERAPRDVIQAAVDAVVSAEGPVLIRCRHGLNRSGLVAALVLRRRGYKPDDAVDLVQARRVGALNNVYFQALVRTWPETSMERRLTEE